MKMRGLMFVILSAAFIFSCGEKASPEGAVTWYDFTTGIKMARDLKRPVLIDFHASWCRWCSVMEKETFNHAEVARRIKNDYIAVKVDLEAGKRITMGSQSFSPREFASMLGVRGLPSVAFMDRNGELITLIPGFVKAGTFIPLLEYIKSECYLKQVSFENYMKKGNCR